MWLRSLAKELELELIKEATISCCDNKGSVDLNENHSRTKHTDIHHHYVSELVSQQSVSVKFRSTKEMIADALTIAVPYQKLYDYMRRIGIK